MKKILNTAKTRIRQSRHHRLINFFLRSVGLLFSFFLIAYIVLAWYISNNQQSILTSITSQLNESLNGELSVKKMEPALLEGFPLVSLELQDVTIRDTLYNQHSKELLNASDFTISINALALLRGAIEIKKIRISDASIYLYTDSIGYSNTSVFKKSKKSTDDSGTTYPEIRNVTFKDVHLVIDNIQKRKNHNIFITSLKGKLDYVVDGWMANVDLDAKVESLAFNTGKGSFIRNASVKGDFKIEYDQDAEQIIIAKSDINIADEDFVIGGKFDVGSTTSNFLISIENEKILWKNASALLSPNISSRLDMFDLAMPISVKCTIKGDLQVKGDPTIVVIANVNDNELSSPGGVVKNCSFTGKFTNNFNLQQGNNDENSAIIISNFKGTYAEIPITMHKSTILNLTTPIITGDFKSDFNVASLGNLIDADLLLFKKGNAKVNLNYRADIVNFKIAKPIVEGMIEVDAADINYIPRSLNFRDISVRLHFGRENLTISNISMKSGKSVVNMKGYIANFLNLYYSAPEEIVLNWEVDSKQLHLGEFIGFLGSRKTSAKPKQKQSVGNLTEDINTIFEQSRVSMKIRVDKLYYKDFTASDARADIFLDNEKIVLKNGGLRHAGGIIAVNGSLNSAGDQNVFEMASVVKNVDVSRFFKAFRNFGIEAMTSENIRGTIYTKADFSGKITNSGDLVTNSINGSAAFHLKNGALLKLKPIKDVGRFAFPNRDFDVISIKDLDGGFVIRGEKISIDPMKFSSSVINMDLEGIYSFGKGTEIYIDVPLRNPERDKEITDSDELAKRRNRGIVLHLTAIDGDDGKVKIKLGSRK